MPLVAPPNEVYEAYQELDLPDPLTNIEIYQTNTTINETLQEFVSEWLLPPGSDLANVTGLVPPDPPAWFEVGGSGMLCVCWTYVVWMLESFLSVLVR